MDAQGVDIVYAEIRVLLPQWAAGAVGSDPTRPTEFTERLFAEVAGVEMIWPAGVLDQHRPAVDARFIGVSLDAFLSDMAAFLDRTDVATGLRAEE